MQSFPFSAFFELGEDYPRPPGPRLHPAALEPADVLLSRGVGDLADCIAASDGGCYSHAALWSGEAVIEARLDGVRERALLEERDVYRYRHANSGLSEAQATAVVARARSRLGGEYATHELLLLGALFALGLFPRRSLLQRALDALGSTSAHRLEQLLEGIGSRGTAVVCTELVALAFYEADPAHELALQVLPIAERPPAPSAAQRSLSGVVDAATRTPGFLPSEAEVLQLNALRRQCLRLCAGALEGPTLTRTAQVEPEAAAASRGPLWGSIAREVHSGTPLGIVTPADLQFSPSLRFVGRVQVQA
jgi:hypothetical protein